MLDMKQFLSAIDQIADEKGIPKDKIIETIEDAIAAAYKKDYGQKGQIVKASLDVESGKLTLRQIKYVVEGADEEGYLTGKMPYRFGEDRDDFRTVKDASAEMSEEEMKIKYNPEKHVLLSEAKKGAEVGDEIILSLETKTDFGRVAAQTAKQVIIQRLREVERDIVFEEFLSKEGEVVSGTVQRREGSVIFIDLGKTNGLLIPLEQLPTDYYRIGQRLRFLVLRVEKTTRGPAIILSRAHPDLVRRLFEFEVPEIESGSVEIKGVAREPGARSKVAVSSNEENVDPIGSLVGQKGVRVQTVINELSGEKIDIIEWDADIKKFISNSLSPARILEVKILDEERRHALAEVADDQFSLAIGKRGQNVRLAAKLTGWKIDVRSPKEALSSEQVEEEVAPTPETDGSAGVAPSSEGESPAESAKEENPKAEESAEKTK